MAKGWYNKRKFLFKIVLILFLVEILAYAYFQANIFLKNKNIVESQKLIDQQNESLSVSNNMTGHLKLALVRQIETTYQTMPWSEHISKVIEMLEDIKNVDTNENDIVVLSDFKVSLDKVSLKGKVSRLRLLYYTNPEKWIQALLDKFSSLEFLQDIRIHSYENKEWQTFEFVLEANVINDGK